MHKCEYYEQYPPPFANDDLRYRKCKHCNKAQYLLYGYIWKDVLGEDTNDW